MVGSLTVLPALLLEARRPGRPRAAIPFLGAQEAPAGESRFWGAVARPRAAPARARRARRGGAAARAGDPGAQHAHEAPELHRHAARACRSCRPTSASRRVPGLRRRRPTSWSAATNVTHAARSAARSQSAARGARRPASSSSRSTSRSARTTPSPRRHPDRRQRRRRRLAAARSTTLREQRDPADASTLPGARSPSPARPPARTTSTS